MYFLRYLVCVGAALTGSQAAKGNSASASKNVVHLDIIGGSIRSLESAPFMVQVFTLLQRPHKIYCGGTLITKKHVLTAGHCVHTDKEMRVYVGAEEHVDPFTNTVDRMYRVTAARTHDNYKDLPLPDGTYSVFDVGVLLLEASVQLGPKVGLIAYTKPNHPPRAGSKVTVVGWGYTQQVNGSASTKLRDTSLTVITTDACRNVFKNAVIPQEFCTTASSKGAFCNGDSGGPAYIGDIQYGVVSWGNCGQGDPAVFANLADPELNRFIKEMVKTLGERH